MSARITWAALIVLACVMLIFGYVLWTKVLFPAPQIQFIDANLEPSSVSPGGRLIVRASAYVRSPPECFSGTQRVIHWANGAEARIPGTRVSTDGSERQSLTYEMTIPENAPVGEATIQIREIFTCGGGQPVNGPVLRFWVVGG